MDKQEWRRRKLAAAAEKVGGSAALGRLMKYKSGAQIGHMLSGRRPITEKTISIIERIHGFSGWFADNQDVGGTPVFERSEMHGTDAGAVASMGAEDAPDAIRIPLLENATSMGRGEEALPADVLRGYLPLSPAWVHGRVARANIGSLRFIHGLGDSMTPTIGHGDILLVDTTQRDPAAVEGIYVLRAQSSLFIKRVRQNLRGQLEVSSDNPAIKTVDVLDGTHEVDVIGRVIWVWNGRRV